MHKLLEYIDDTMQEYEEKVARGGDLSLKDVEYLKDLAKTKMAILTNEAMERESEDYDGYSRDGDMRDGHSYRGRMYYDGGHSYAGRRGNVKRDSMGRYSRRGYSYADAKEDMISELKELAKKAPDEKTRQELEHFANEMENK